MKYPILRPNKYTSLGIGLLLLVILLSIVFSMFFSSFSVEGFQGECKYGNNLFKNNPDCYYHVVHKMYNTYLILRSKIDIAKTYNLVVKQNVITEFNDVKTKLNDLYDTSTGDNKIKHEQVLKDYINNKNVKNLTHPLQ
jgi:hypothetical protein